MTAYAGRDLDVSSTSGGSIVDKVESFVEATVSALQESETPDDAVKAVEETGKELAQAAADQAEAAAEIREKNKEIRDRVDDVEEHADRVDRSLVAMGSHIRRREPKGFHGTKRAKLQRKIYDVKDRVDAIEEGDFDGETPTPEGDETGVQSPDTALEDIIRVPEHLVDDALTANQKRARFVAKDVNDYSTKVPAGHTVRASELRRVLTAKEESRVHTQTVSRVIDFLDDLGGDDVEVRELRDGERAVVFDDEIVRRIVEWQKSDHIVVSGDRATG